jgi:hypothetical protein
MTDCSVEGVAQMVSTGLGLPEKAFLDAGRYGWVDIEDRVLAS